MSIKFRDLMPSEIDVRVSVVRQNGVQLLLYKTSRVDSTLLDETVGPENWQCRFYEVNGVTYCSIGIRILRVGGLSEWVWKDDAGSEGNIEKEKSVASSAFKRAGFKWSIGKPLYTAPFIWVNEKQARIKNQNGRYICNDKFKVSNIKYVDGKIMFLEIVNTTSNMIVFRWGAK